MKKQVHNASLRAMKGKITFREIADHIGYHENSVWGWFNKGEMKEDKRQKVEQAIRELQEQKKE